MSDIPYTNPEDPTAGAPLPTDEGIASAKQAADVIHDVEALHAGLGQPGGIATLGSDGILTTAQQPAGPTGIGLANGIAPLDGNARLPNKFSPVTTGLYVPSDFGRTGGWNTARAAASSRLVNVVFWGASIMQGSFASSYDGTSWVGRLISDLQTAYGDGGSGYKSTFMAQFTAASGISTTGSSGTFAGGWDLSAIGPNASTLVPHTAGNGATVTDTHLRGRYVDIFWQQFTAAGNHFSYSVDGATAVVVDCTIGSLQGIGVTTIDTGVVGTHSLVVTAAAGSPGIFGWRGRNATGIMPIRMLKGGASNADLTGGGLPGLDVYGNTPQGALIFGAGWTSLFGPLAPAWATNWSPDLVVMGDRFLNDMFTAAATPAQVASYFAMAVEFIREQIGLTTPNNPWCDFVVVLPHRGAMADAGNLYPQYRAVIRTMCEAYGAALIDLWAIGRNSDTLWGDATGQLGYWGSGTTGNGAAGAANGPGDPHLSDVGHAFVESLVLPILTAA